MKFRHRRHAPTLGLLALLAAAVGMLSCYPGDDLTVADTDLVVTAYNQSTDFAQVFDYALADSIVHLVPEGQDDDISRNYDQQMLDEVRSNMDALGFSEVSDPSVADVLIVIGVTAADYQGYYSYSPCYWYCWYYPYPPGWGWYYPPYIGTYEFRIGTVIINMVKRDSSGESVTVEWVGALNGYSDKNSNLARIRSGIDQAFKQSPYLGAGK